VNKALLREKGKPAEPMDAPTTPSNSDTLPIIGSSPAMQEVYRLVARLVNTNLNVLITGESGTGKDLVARVLHDFGSRRSGPFVEVNLGSMSAEEIDAAFTLSGGETVLQMIKDAQGGTLFFNEIGDLDLEGQTLLLRLLQDLGNDKNGTNVRVLAATHQNLAEQIRQGSFREDLFYRLNVVPIRLPPLRERIDDIADLVRHFLRKAASEGLPSKVFSAEALNALRMQNWHGNVRELENLVQRVVVLVNDEQIELSTLEDEFSAAARRPDQGSSGTGEKLADAVQIHLQRYFDLHGESLPPAGLYHRVLREVELPLFALSLSATHGNQVKTAEMLGINRNTLRKKIKDLDIRVTRGKKMM